MVETSRCGVSTLCKTTNGMKENNDNNDSKLSSLNSKLSINQWAEEDRPREKLAAMGAESLTNAELLAILIGSTTA